MGDVLRFTGCKLVIKLIAQTPLIHFQSGELGATLRGSELKPKLDKFLNQKMGKKENTALNYKVQITCEQQSRFVEVGVLPSKKNGIEESYSIFFGNTGRASHEKLKGIWSDPILTIICFDNKLKQVIENFISEFFYVTNFGMMQDKGFGSYVTKGTKVDKATIKKWLKEDYDVTSCWSMSYKGTVTSPDQLGNIQFQMIKSFYGIMKSGQSHGEYERSFLFEYMHKNNKKCGNTANIINGIDNEKAWMKQNQIAPVVSKKENEKKHDLNDKNPKYVRALLGLSGTQLWIEELGDKNVISRASITITDPSGLIERISSPVFFKIVGKEIFFIIHRIPTEVYDHNFSFNRWSMKAGRLDKIIKTINLSTPSREQFTNREFDTETFMNTYVMYFNGECSKKVRISRYFTKIEK